jgi:hypothetical protein
MRKRQFSTIKEDFKTNYPLIYNALAESYRGSEKFILESVGVQREDFSNPVHGLPGSIAQLAAVLAYTSQKLCKLGPRSVEKLGIEGLLQRAGKRNLSILYMDSEEHNTLPKLLSEQGVHVTSIGYHDRPEVGENHTRLTGDIGDVDFLHQIPEEFDLFTSWGLFPYIMQQGKFVPIWAPSAWTRTVYGKLKEEGLSFHDNQYSNFQNSFPLDKDLQGTYWFKTTKELKKGLPSISKGKACEDSFNGCE